MSAPSPANPTVTGLAPKRPHPIDRWMPWFFVAFFVVLTGAGGWLAWFASQHDRGVITDQAYQKGLRYNETLASAAAQAQLGWQLQLAPPTATPGGTLFVVTASDAAGAPLLAELTLTLQRPTQAGMDITTPMVPRADQRGVYQAIVPLPVPGLWQAYVQATREADKFQLSQRLVIQP